MEVGSSQGGMHRIAVHQDSHNVEIPVSRILVSKTSSDAHCHVAADS